MPIGSGGVDYDQRRSGSVVLDGSLLEIYGGRPLPQGGRVASHLRHTLDYMEPLKRGGVQGSNPLRGCSSARSEGPGVIMEPS